MTTTSNRELLALRTWLATHLRPADTTHLGMTTIAKAAEPALARGWTGEELGALSTQGIYDGTITNPGGYIVANLRDLGTVDPPREVTPAPPPIAEVLAQIHGQNQTTTDHHAWVTRIRDQTA